MTSHPPPRDRTPCLFGPIPLASVACVFVMLLRAASAQDLPTITVNTAEPASRIARVAVNGWPVEETGQGIGSVRIAIPPDGAGQLWCVNDVAITIASGDHASRTVDVCEGGDTIIIDLGEDDRGVPQQWLPARLRWTTADLLPASVVQVPVREDQGESTPVLSFGIPQTDARLIDVTCLNGFDGARFSVAQFADGVDPGILGRITIRFRNSRKGPVRLSYDAPASEPVSEEEPSQLSLSLALSDPLFAALRFAEEMSLSTNGSEYIVVSLSNGRQAIESFMERCKATAATASPLGETGGETGGETAALESGDDMSAYERYLEATSPGGGGEPGAGARTGGAASASGRTMAAPPGHAETQNEGLSAYERHRAATASTRAGERASSSIPSGPSLPAGGPADPGAGRSPLPSWLDTPQASPEGGARNTGEVASVPSAAPSPAAPSPQPRVLDPFPRLGGVEGDYERRRRYFQDYMATCATDGVCEAVTFSATETYGGGTFMSNLAFTRAPGRNAGWEITYAGPFEPPAGGSIAIADIDGERWRLAPDRDYARVGNSSVFLPPHDRSLMRAMRAGSTLRTTHTLPSGARKTVDYSLRGLTAAMRWIASRQRRSPRDLTLRVPRSR